MAAGCDEESEQGGNMIIMLRKFWFPWCYLELLGDDRVGIR